MRMIKSRRMGLAEHVSHIGAKRNAYRILMGKLDGKRPLEDLKVGGNVKSKRNRIGCYRLDSSGSG
jgi:hypothetical protein